MAQLQSPLGWVSWFSCFADPKARSCHLCGEDFLSLLSSLRTSSASSLSQAPYMGSNSVVPALTLVPSLQLSSSDGILPSEKSERYECPRAKPLSIWVPLGLQVGGRFRVGVWGSKSAAAFSIEKSLSAGRVESTIPLNPLPRSLLLLGCALPVGGTGAWESSLQSTAGCPDHPRSLVR